MKNTILHISHTDIRSDSRILKELRSLAVLPGYELVGVGVLSSEGAALSGQDLKARVVAVPLRSRVFTAFPRPIRYAINMVELTLRLLWYGLWYRPVVVHCHDTLVLPAGLLIKMLTGCSLVYDAHELESDKNGQTPILSKGTLKIERFAWSKIDLLISVSDEILKWYIDKLGIKETALILNAPEVPYSFEAEGRAVKQGGYFRNLYGISEARKIFIYVGILGPGRGIELCLRIFADLVHDAHIVFLGYGPLVSLVEQYVAANKNIHLHQAVPHDQVVPLVQNADVGLCFVENVSLSDYYSLPNKLFEYAFAGIPVLASDFPEIRRVVTQYSLGACTAADDPQAIEKSIAAIAERGLEAPSEDLSALSWSAQAARLVGSYRTLLGNESLVR